MIPAAAAKLKFNGRDYHEKQDKEVHVNARVIKAVDLIIISVCAGRKKL